VIIIIMTDNAITTSTTTTKVAEKKNATHPTDEMIRQAIVDILPTVDLATTGVKKFRKLLKRHFSDGGSGGGGDNVDLSTRHDFIQKTLTEVINNMDNDKEEDAEEEEEDVDNNSSDDDDDGDDDDNDDDDGPSTPTKKKQNKGGYNAPKEISNALATFLGRGKEMSRPQIVKYLWEYIKEHSLQNPNNKREILLDDKMKTVFGCDMFTMFAMNKYISAHTHPFHPLDLTTNKNKTSSNTIVTPSPISGKRSSRNTRVNVSRPQTIQNQKKKRKTGTQPPYRLSQALVDVLGKEILPRPQVVSGLWVYIKANNLQNPQDKREIICNDELSKIFGNKKKVTMFSMNKYITPHLIEKVERADYQHDDNDGSHDDDEGSDDNE